MRSTKKPCLTLVALLSAISLQTGCASRPLVVRPAAPVPPPKIVVPAFLLMPPPKPSWLP